MRTTPKPGCTEPRGSIAVQIGQNWRGVGEPDR